MSMSSYYNRFGEEITVEEWGRLADDLKYKRVAETNLPDGKWVSTVWLGLNHSFNDKDYPIIFETMVFPSQGNYTEIYCDRYHTELEAIFGHIKAVRTIHH